MEPPECPKPHRTETWRGDEECQVLVGLPTIALGEEEAARFLEALERPDDRTVAKFAELRRRA